MYYVDSNGNAIIACRLTKSKADGEFIWVARLADDPDRGYLLSYGGVGVPFGTEDQPWSEGTIHTWFGEGERYPDAYAAILSIRDQCCSY